MASRRIGSFLINPGNSNATQFITTLNDGAGSGFDADLLDGQHGSYYATKASPAFTGTPTAPTASAGTNTTQLATTAFVSTAVSNLVDSAPGTLDTLNELAAALGDDSNFSTTVTNSIATKLSLSGGTMTGNIAFSGAQTVDGRDLSADGSKLDGIAAGAEVNVQSDWNATSGDALILNKPTIPTNNNQLTNGAGYITSSGSITGSAGTLDGIDSSQFLRSDTADTAAGVITFTGRPIVNTGATENGIRFRGASLDFVGRYSNYVSLFNQSNTSREIKIPDSGDVTIGGNAVWHAGNDGAGSSLDADLLDGQQGSYYLNYNNLSNTPTIPTNNNQLTNGAGYITSSGSITGSAGTLDGLDSTQFLRSDANDTYTGTLTFNANSKIIFGPNSTWGRYLSVGGNGYGGGTNTSSIATTNGNLHIDAASATGYATYLNFYAGTAGVAFGNGAQGVVAWMGPDGDLWKGGSDNSGSKYWHAGNDGSGSGLDADLLDGQQGSYYQNASNINAGTLNDARLSYTELGRSPVGNFGQWAGHSSFTDFNTPPTYWGWTYVTGTTNAPNTSSNQWYRGRFSLGNQYGLGSDAGDYWMEMAIPRSNQGGSPGNLWIRTCENGAEQSWYQVAATISGNTTWHAGNDGSGSGLDADLLDGQQGSYYLNYNNLSNKPTIPTNNNQLTNGAGYITSSGSITGSAGTLDGLDSTQFLRSDADDIHTGRLAVGNFIGSISPGFSVVGDANSSPIVAKTSNINTTFAVLPYNSGITFVSSGIYYDDGSWVHASDNTNNCLLALSGSGTNWYASNNSTGSWNVASNVSLWTSQGYWNNRLSTSVTYNGNTIWHAGNDGAGSGLDADLLDGIQSSSFLRSDAADTATGIITFNADTRYGSQSSQQGGGLAVQRVWSKSVAAGQLYQLGTWNDTEGVVSLLIQVSSKTAGNSGTSTYLWQGGYNQLQGSYFRLYPLNVGRGHGAGADTGENTNAWQVFIYGTTVTGSSYTYGLAVHVASGASTKNLVVTATELKRGMTFTDQGSSSVITSFTNSGNIFSNRTVLAENVKIGSSFSQVWHAGNDGAGSGLDADLLDGLQPSVSASNNTIVQRHSLGYIYANYFNTNPNDVTSGVTKVCVETGNDGFIRHGTAAAIRTFIGAGSGGGLDADLLDGQQGSYYLNYNNLSNKPTIPTNNNQLTNGAGYITSSGSITGSAGTLDGLDSTQFLRSDADDSTSGYLQAEGFVGSGGILRIANPGGASSSAGASSSTGYLKITLPVSWTNTMMRMTIRVYEYTNGESFDVHCGGYNYSGNNSWINTFAYILNDPSFTGGRNFNVRFGHDGTKCAIYIGESNSTWSYVNFAVTEFLAGHSNYTAASWHNGWSCSVTTTLGTITSTESNVQVGKWVDGNVTWHAGNDGAGSGLDADLLDGYTTATGATANTIALRDGSGHLTMNYGFGSYFNMSHATGTRTADTIFYSSTDNYIRKTNATGMRSSLNVPTRTGGDASGTWGISITGNAATATTATNAGTLDSLDSTQFVRSDANDEATGSYLFNRNTTTISNSSYAQGQNHIELRTTNQTNPIIGFHRSGYSATALYHAGYGINSLRMRNADGNDGPIFSTFNDGAGSGLDADLLDGVQGASYLRSDADDTFTRLSGTRVSCGFDSGNDNSVGCSNWFRSSGATGWYNQTYAGGWYMSDTTWIRTYNNKSIYHNTGVLRTDGTLQVGNNGATFSAPSGGTVTISGSTAWHAGNDGSGSGLDADLLDGLNAATTGANTIVRTDASGNIAASGNVTAYSSDRRLKENFNHIDSPVEKVQKLNGYTFDWNEKSKELGFTPKHEKNDIGLIAQEVEDILPQAVAPAPFDTKSNGESKSGENYLTIQYERLVPLLVEAIKEQQNQINKLTQEIEQLKK